jgi:hypothetical protein
MERYRMGAILFDLPKTVGTEDGLLCLHGLHGPDTDVRLRPLPVELQPLTAPETIMEILRAWGPFYLCRFRLSMPGAVLVIGVNSGTGSLSCREGSGAGGVRVQPYGMWIARWRNRREPFHVLVAPCRQRNQRWQGRGGCPHTAQALRLNEEGGCFRAA